MNIGNAISAIVALLTMLAFAASAQGELALRFITPQSSESRIASNVVLRVGAGETPSPFLAPGPLAAEWTGWLHADLRGDFQFQARTTGAFDLEINGTQVLRTPHASGADTADWSPAFRLRKGTNFFRARLSRTNDSEVFVRLSWRGRGWPPSAIPASVFSPPEPSDRREAADHSAARRGLDLFLFHRCGKCHSTGSDTALPEREADAPSFRGIGARRDPAWMARWILDPGKLQPSATMPAVMHGPTAPAEAAKIAAWLSRQREPVPKTARFEIRPVPAIGHSLFESLRCGICHTRTGEPVVSDRVSLGFVPEKFRSRAGLVEYLENPGRHYAWTRMPDFRLAPEEAVHLASYLMTEGGDESPRLPDVDAKNATEGKALAYQHGCFRCHDDPETDPTHRFPTESEPRGSARPENPSAAATRDGPAPGIDGETVGFMKPPPVRALVDVRHPTGCLSESTAPDVLLSGRPPRFRFRSEDRADLVAFLAHGEAPFGRPIPAEFARRWTAALRCAGCHDQNVDVPRLEGLGGKLRPEWTTRFLSGHVAYKPRPWLESRMPAFPVHARGLAEGFAALDGVPPRSPVEPPIEADAVAIGKKLVSASAGFACVSCHAVGRFQASAVFEAPGINFAHVADRLLPDYFHDWVRNPQAFDPSTKMPLYFDEEGNSVLADYYGGDGPRTLRALWNYLRSDPVENPAEP